MKKSRKNIICLEKIDFYCSEISKILASHQYNKEYFEHSSEMQYACSMCIIQIGELITIMDDEFKNDYTEIPWRQIKGARNVYVHQYGEIDLDEMWNTLIYSIPDLESKITEILRKSQDETGV